MGWHISEQLTLYKERYLREKLWEILGSCIFSYGERLGDTTLSATGDCTTANDVIILQTVPIPKVTLL